MPRQQNKLSRMSRLEIDAVKLFCSEFNFEDKFYPVQIAQVLRQNCIIGEDFYDNITRMHNRNKYIFEAIVNEVVDNCTLDELIAVFYNSNFKKIAQGLFVAYIRVKTSLSVCRVNKADTSNRKKLGEYFKQIKQQVHAMCFNDAHSDVKEISERMKQRIENTTEPSDRMRRCDIYVALKAAEMDALTNVAGIVSENHEGYLEIEKYKNVTSNPALTEVLLYGRQSDVVSTVGKFEHAEDLMKRALVAAETSGSCVEITDMLYKYVVVKLSKFEKHPNDEGLRKSIIYEADKGLWTLQGESEDLRIFWTKLFLLRIIFAHLGIGKFCDIIEGYIPSPQSLEEAERVLKLAPLQDLEHRRQMFIAVAKARLHEWKNDIEQANLFLKLARKLAAEGRYAEDRALGDYEKVLEAKLHRYNEHKTQTQQKTQSTKMLPYIDPISEMGQTTQYRSLSPLDEAYTQFSTTDETSSIDQTSAKTFSSDENTDPKMSVSFETLSDLSASGDSTGESNGDSVGLLNLTSIEESTDSSCSLQTDELQTFHYNRQARLTAAQQRKQ